jgi:hypothetical protein
MTNKIGNALVKGYLDDGQVTTIDPTLWPQTGKTITVYGAATTQVTTKFNNTAGFFNGTTDYVVVPDSTNWAIGTGDFDIEAFVNFASVTTTCMITAQDTGAASDFWFAAFVGNGTGWDFRLKIGNVQQILFQWNDTLTLNTWYHVRFQRVSGVIKCYRDGVEKTKTYSTGTGAESIPNFAADMWIGEYKSGGGKFSGWIKELRISNVARATTVPTSQYTTDANTLLLLHFDTPATTPLSPAIAFSGLGNYLSLEDHADWDTGTGDFTSELFISFNSFAASACGIDIGGSVDGIRFSWVVTTNVLRAFVKNTFFDNPWTPVVGVWYHIAIVRNGNTVRAYINGVLQATTLDVTGISITGLTSGVRLGQNFTNAHYLNGYIKEARISNIARYTSSFTPSQLGWTVDANTKLYIKGNEGNGVGNVYPPVQNGTYVQATTTYANARYMPYFCTDPTKPDLTTAQIDISWLTAVNVYANQRFHIDLGDAKVVTNVRYVNGHNGNLDATIETGVENFTFWGSNSSASFAELTYGTDTGWTQLPAVDAITGLTKLTKFDGSEEFLNVTNTTPYRYYAFKFVNCWGGVQAYMSVRRLELRVGKIVDSATVPKVISQYGDVKIKYTEDYRSCVFFDSSSNMANNGNFESWASASSCNNWYLSQCTVARESIIVHSGTYSAKVTSTGAATEFYSDQIPGFKNKTATWGAWVYCTTANTARVFVTDAITYSYYSSYHTGDSTWQYLTVSHSNIGNSDVMRPELIVANGGVAYIDDGFLQSSDLAQAKKPYPVGSAKVDFKAAFGTGAGYFNGASSLSIPNSADINFGTADLTWETYFRSYDISTSEFIVNRQFVVPGYDGIGWYVPAGAASIGLSYMALSYTWAYQLVVNTWYHLVLERVAGVWKAWVNGIRIGTDFANATGYDIVNPMYIGSYENNQQFMKGLLDNVRISKGIARYTGTFNPPSSTPITDDQTKLLLTMEGTGSAFVDSSLASPTPPTETQVLDNWSRLKVLMDYSVNSGSMVTQAVVSTYSLIYTVTTAYGGGVLNPAGEIHFVPYIALTGQKINVYSNIVSTYAFIQAGGYFGGALDIEGSVHFAPFSAGVGQKVSISNVVSTYALLYTTTNAYGGACSTNKGELHFIPYSATVGQKISPYGLVATYSLAYTTTSAYLGGVLAPNGDLHFVPFQALVGQKVSKDGVVSTYSILARGYYGGVVAPNGDIHFILWSGSVGQKISMSGVVSTYSLVQIGGHIGGVLAPTGDIHMISYNAPVGQKISTNGVVSTYSIPFTHANMCYGGVLAPNGDIHCIPASSAVGRKISTLPSRPFSKTICCSPWLNKI